MPIHPDELRQMVEAELSEVSDERVLARIRAALVDPTLLTKRYEFSVPPAFHPCWLVWQSSQTERGVAFSEFGFGPRRPWGMIFTSGTEAYHSSMGADDDWHKTFLEAWPDEDTPIDLPIWRVARWAGGAVEYLSERGSWKDRWCEAKILRENDQGVFYYDVDTDIFRRKRRFVAKRRIG